MPLKNPSHPGGFVLRQCIEPLGLTIKDAAAALGVTRTTLSELVNGKRGIISRNGRTAFQGLRGKRRELAYAAGALRCRTSARRPDQAEASPIRLSVGESLERPSTGTEAAH